jgi:alkyldihydroxyacetonephosphate synthase
MSLRDRPLKHWGWGYADEQPSAGELRSAAAGLREHLGFGWEVPELPAALPALRASRLTAPTPLAEICSAQNGIRARHSYGRSYRDVVRGFRGDYPDPVDLVCTPRSEAEVEAALEWAVDAGAAVIPYGGGTSVVGGVEPIGLDGYAGVVSLDLGALDRVLEVDEVSLSARVAAGASGPRLEAGLAERGLTLRHYPQSFQHQTLGGAIATRAGGHFATRHTHIDDFVESIRALTPTGWWESRRLPGSGAAVSPDRMLLGSEGTLGVITEAWVRVRRRPRFRASASVRFKSFWDGARAIREILQAGFGPANCRLIDPDEARLTFAGDGTAALLLLAFESAHHEVEPELALSLECCRDHGGRWDSVRGSDRSGDPSGAWRDAFLRAPYLRDTFVAMGVISETFETAITWERLPEFHASVTAATRSAVDEICGSGRGSVTCRLTHVYPDGAAPYFTVLAPARRGAELQQWDAIKAAASDAIIAGGGTITHHHAVGRDHRPWYDRQRPEPFARALAGAKTAIDPSWSLNPGALIDRP